jgi:hypothetical protein
MSRGFVQNRTSKLFAEVRHGRNVVAEIIDSLMGRFENLERQLGRIGGR